MNTQKNVFKKVIICLAAIGFVFNLSQAQMLQLENENSSLTVFGSSNLHGWKVDAQTQNGSISFDNLKSCEILHLSLAVLTESLKGVKPGITEKASETLKSDQYKYILFTLSQVEHVTNQGSGVFDIQAYGDLIIAGTKQKVPLDFRVTMIDNRVKLEGKTKLKMTTFNLTPPEALMGTIQAKDDIVLRFNTSFIQSTVL